MNLIAICVAAFTMVFSVLGLLAAAMYFITLFFPERVAVVDGAVVAAISSTVASLFPGSRVTRVEEES